MDTTDSYNIFMYLYINHLIYILNSYWDPGEFILVNDILMYDPERTKFTNQHNQLIYEALDSLNNKLTNCTKAMDDEQLKFIKDVYYSNNSKDIINKILISGSNFDIVKIKCILCLT